MVQKESLLIKIMEHDGLKLIVEEDDEAAFAYLQSTTGIVAHVWLYNVCATPVTPPWKEGRKLPCANPYSNDAEITRRAIKAASLKALYDFDAAGFVIFDEHGVLAYMNENTSTGGSVVATKNGPLAYVLDGDFADYDFGSAQ